MLNVWARKHGNEKCLCSVTLTFDIVYEFLFLIFLANGLKSPLLFLLESSNPSNVSPGRVSVLLCSDVVFNNSPIFPFEFPNFSLTMFEVRTILRNLIFAAHTTSPPPLASALNPI